VLRISAKVDYAVRALIEVARGGGQPVKAHVIAEAQGIPVRFLGAVLTHLRRSGLVESRRGGDGGYWLARPSNEICVADVIAAIDGEVIDVRALPGPASDTSAMWHAAARSVESVLTGVTIADLIGQPPDIPQTAAS
jgi:Rrf2 family protein